MADSGVMKNSVAQKPIHPTKALAFLANVREEDGRWDIRKSGGQAGHDVSSTAFSLLAFMVVEKDAVKNVHISQ